MNRHLVWQLPALAVAVAALAAFPLVADGYYLALGISMLNYVVLATAWALFSGPTRYISLATAAFFGIGAYTTTILWEKLPAGLVIAVAAAIAVAVALVVGLSTLRLRGMYFVIFTFGLAELIRQIVTWYETKVTGTVGRYIFLTISQEQYYWELLALAVAVFVVGWLIGRSRLGLALRVIGDDETGRPPRRHQHHRVEAGAVRDQRRVHGGGRRDHGAALDLHRAAHRLQPADLLPGRHHGAARRRRAALRAAARRRAAGHRHRD